MTRTTTRTRLSQYYVVRARERASFWRENMIDVVLLLRVLGECRNVGSKLSTFSSFLILCSGESLTYVSSFIILYSGESLTSFHKNKRADFSGQRSTMKLSGMSIFVKYENRGRPCPRIYRSIFITRQTPRLL